MHALCYGFGSDGLNRDSPLGDKVEAEVEKRQCQRRASGRGTRFPSEYGPYSASSRTRHDMDLERDQLYLCARPRLRPDSAS